MILRATTYPTDRSFVADACSAMDGVTVGMSMSAGIGVM